MDKNLEELFRKCIKLYFHRKRDVLEGMGLFRGQTPIIYILWEKDGRTQKELSKEMEINPATISKMINRMEKSGFIEKKRDEEDKRTTRIYLTEKAKKTKSRLDKEIGDFNKEVFSGFSDKDNEVFSSYLIKILNNLS